ncbi:protein kinase subdomain-containing protein [Pseudozyma hubeiensis SY62]|uniref:Protein kinase subdomain-containing protein n=1 Tax=Pseudozyma hubeiensis (strain SY62) TaxID=1305764 RepID=R9P6G4_PSEHS|nr:protein kinase subdomain-containing protein [Pseudozyma hubeiensis SY62]GAC96946.1 protein kinase subdomain-containing protein [Pseudozyma hubeiensis SY62]
MLARIFSIHRIGISLLVITSTIALASSSSGLFVNTSHGQSEWSRYCSGSASRSADLQPHACFTMHDDVTSAAHSSSEGHLGFASASGQDFVVIPPHQGQDSKVEFFASGFWFSIHFSDSLKCARVEIRAPVRSPAKPDRQDKERALEPFLEGTNCVGTKPNIFAL